MSSVCLAPRHQSGHTVELHAGLDLVMRKGKKVGENVAWSSQRQSAQSLDIREGEVHNKTDMTRIDVMISLTLHV